ncbi:hypothetical protein WS72_25735 [Burkholderia savannae]|uniref:Uncharacterized protein n=1 Tax=Burkholderia savannae TaxID=1637837 RepID=A0ABR5T4W4_9BURK|nr:hypothetical protein [Burkholderia savannae]KWZ38272.1 hypothetical protein WS72_25735 [Burkholderia savannae]
MVKANRNFRTTSAGQPAIAAIPAVARPRAPDKPPRQRALRAFLSARVGLAWAPVRTELAQRFPELSDVPASLVATHTSTKHGRVRVHAAHGVVALEEAGCAFYVHPELGTLMRNAALASRLQHEKEREARRAEELHARMRPVSAHTQAHKIGSTWYLVELDYLPFPRREAADPAARHAPEHATVFDAVLGRVVDASDRFDLEHIYGRRGVYGARRRELSYRELRDLGLLAPART